MSQHFHCYSCNGLYAAAVPPPTVAQALCLHKRKGKENNAGSATSVKTLPTSVKEERTPRAKAQCIPFTKRNKRKKSMGISRVTSSSPCLILVMRVYRSLLKSGPGAGKFIGVLGGMGMKLQSKLGG
eukprot:833126-Pelagomonas_calceolata.AAC.14